MNTSHKSITVLALCAGLISVAPAQEFNLNRQTGQLKFITTGLGQSSTEFVGFSSLTFNETAFIDTAHSTIRQYGSLALPGLQSPTLSFQSTQTFPPSFPNPSPTTVTGNLSMSFSFPAQTLNFDTGARTIIWTGTEWTFDGMVTLQLGVNFAYSFTSGGQTESGTGSATLGIPWRTSGGIILNNYPDSIDLGRSDFGGGFSKATIFSFTADNKFQAAAFISAVPEPSSTALAALAIGVLAWSRRRKAIQCGDI